MKTPFQLFLALALMAGWAIPLHASPLRLDNASSGDPLSISAFDGDFRVKLSSYLDIEGYALPKNAPGLIYTDESALVNPRLSVFLDGQAGSSIYFFLQARLDRGFDPSDGPAAVRLDEYALRYTLWDDGRISLQVGKFSTVVGNWVKRHLSWDNPFINAPLPYENLTGIWGEDAAASAEELLQWAHMPSREWPYADTYSDKRMRVPIIWGPSYASGVSIAGRLGDFDYAVEVKNASLSSGPEYWDVTQVGFEHPTVSGRIGYRPNMAWNIGLSASSGSYLAPEAKEDLPPGKGLSAYQERVLAQDISFEWHHFQFWSEVYAARFEVPTVGHADTLAYYLEAKYKFTPQFFGALRWNQQFFGSIPYEGTDVPWGSDTSRVDAALGYRFTPNMQLKLQYSLQNDRWSDPNYSHTFAAQLTYSF